MNGNREQLKQAILAQENLRGTVDDAIIDIAISALRQQLTTLEASEKEQQRKLVTLLFVDVVESTKLVRDLDPEDNLAIMDTGLQRLAAPISKYGGRATRFMGDGFKAVFGLPIARENDPEMAVRAGLAVLEAARTYAQELKAEQGIASFQVRVGINTGLVATGGQTEAESTIMGSAVNLAARMESAALADSLLISHLTYQHVKGIFNLEAREPILAKGFVEPVLVYLVHGAKTHTYRLTWHGVEGIETQMIGREAELEILQNGYNSLVQGSERQMVTVVGDAGLGKSRLLFEFEDWIDDQPIDVEIYQGRARLEARNLPFGLLKDLFSSHFAIYDDDLPHIMREKVIAGFGNVLGDGEFTEMKSHLIGQFLGFDFRDSPHLEDVLDDPRQLHDRASIYLIDYFKTVSKNLPIVVFIEDLQWADDSSLNLIKRLLPALEYWPIFFVASTRPEFYETRPAWDSKQGFHTRVDLLPLSKQDSSRLVGEVLQKVSDVPSTVRELIINNAEGNPFYVEELVKMLVEDGVILKTEPTWQIRPELLEEMHVPPTLTGVLQARLDSLPAVQRTLLQQASVVGRVFWDTVIEHLSQMTDYKLSQPEMRQMLVDLREKELIFRSETSSLTNTQEHVFKHALLHEVTYASVLKSIRKNYHALVAQWLIEYSEEQSGNIIGLTAHHMELAGQTAQAIDFYQQAGEQAFARYANEEALHNFDSALKLIDEQDFATLYPILIAKHEIYVHTGKRVEGIQNQKLLRHIVNCWVDESAEHIRREAEVLLISSYYGDLSGDIEALEESIQTAVALAKEYGSLELELKALSYLGNLYWDISELDKAREMYELMLAKAEPVGEYLTMAMILRDLAATEMFSGGKAARIMELIERSLAYFRMAGNLKGIANTLNKLGFLSVAQGEGVYGQARENYEEALQINRRMGDRGGERLDLRNLGVLLTCDGDYRQAVLHANEALEIARESDNLLAEAFSLNYLGFTIFNMGDLKKAKSLQESSLGMLLDLDNKQFIAKALTALGTIYLCAHDYEQALDYVSQAIEYAQGIHEQRQEAYAHTCLGRVLAQLGRYSEARQAFERAVLLHERMEQVNRRLEPLAGIANLSYQEGDQQAALKIINEILAHLETHRLDRTNEGFFVYLTCYRLLDALGDARVKSFLLSTYKQLESRAATIDDDETRDMFWNDLTGHKEILEVASLYLTKNE